MNAALTIPVAKESPLPLYLIRQPPPPSGEPSGTRDSPTASEWTDPRYSELVATWEGVHPPPGIVGFVDPLP